MCISCQVILHTDLCEVNIVVKHKQRNVALTMEDTERNIYITALKWNEMKWAVCSKKSYTFFGQVANVHIQFGSS